MTGSQPDWSSEGPAGSAEQPDWFTAGPPPPPPPSRGRRFVAGSGAALRASGRAIGRGSRATARGVAIGSRAANARFQRFSRADGADASGLARFVEMHGINVAADAALTVSLAGTVFAMPVDEARGQVALFLLLTMAPFVVLAPLIGPVLDRFRHGRRWAIGATLALRGFLAWVLASAIVDDSAWLFPAALGCLVASRAYAVARAAAIPRLLPDGMTLVRANSRLNIVGILGMTLGGVLAGAVSRIGPEWSLRLAFVIYVLATIWAIRLPAAVDSTIGEGEVDDTVPNPTDSATPSRFRHRVRVLPPDVRYALWLNSGARILTGFLTLFLAFLMR
ncbi:MAG TPA: MFS transporter, partial [Phycicoccus sp.]|nr:MFS transporter [Phycicoccus sp.]